MDLINRLPNELLSKIFVNMELDDWLYKLPLVCHRWKDLLDFLWNSVSDVTFNGYKAPAECVLEFFSGEEHLYKISENIFNLILRKSSNCLQYLHISYKDDKDRDGETFSANLHIAGDQIKILSLNMRGYFIEAIARQLGALPNLECLRVVCFNDFSTVPMTDNFGLIFNVCKNLRTVNCCFDYLQPPPVTVIQRLVKLPYLNVLVWRTFLAVEPHYVETLLATLAVCSDSLEKFLFSCGLSAPLNVLSCQTSMNAINTRKSIKHLELGINPEYVLPDDSQYVYPECEWSDAFLVPLANFQHLRELVLDYLDFSTETSRSTIQSLSSHLTSLSLGKARGLNIFLRNFSGQLPVMEKINLRLIEGDHDEEVMDISCEMLRDFAMLCPKLRTFSLNFLADGCIELVVLLHHAIHMRDRKGGEKFQKVFNFSSPNTPANCLALNALSLCCLHCKVDEFFADQVVCIMDDLCPNS